MRYIINFMAKDKHEICSYMLANKEDAISLGKCLARNQTFTIWREKEVAEHYLSWTILETVQELCCEYKNGEKI
jgi:hypothetical protein